MVFLKNQAPIRSARLDRFNDNGKLLSLYAASGQRQKLGKLRGKTDVKEVGTNNIASFNVNVLERIVCNPLPDQLVSSSIATIKKRHYTFATYPIAEKLSMFKFNTRRWRRP